MSVSRKARGRREESFYRPASSDRGIVTWSRSTCRNGIGSSCASETVEPLGSGKSWRIGRIISRLRGSFAMERVERGFSEVTAISQSLRASQLGTLLCPTVTGHALTSAPCLAGSSPCNHFTQLRNPRLALSGFEVSRLSQALLACRRTKDSCMCRTLISVRLSALLVTLLDQRADRFPSLLADFYSLLDL